MIYLVAYEPPELSPRTIGSAKVAFDDFPAWTKLMATVWMVDSAGVGGAAEILAEARDVVGPAARILVIQLSAGAVGVHQHLLADVSHILRPDPMSS